MRFTIKSDIIVNVVNPKSGPSLKEREAILLTLEQHLNSLGRIVLPEIIQITSDKFLKGDGIFEVSVRFHFKGD